MNPPSPNRTLEDELKQLCYDMISIAEHFHDPEYQKKHFRTMHPRSNINGRFGEFEKVLANYRKTQATALLEKGPRDKTVRSDPKTIESKLRGEPYTVDQFNAGYNSANAKWRSIIKEQGGLE